MLEPTRPTPSTSPLPPPGLDEEPIARFTDDGPTGGGGDMPFGGGLPGGGGFDPGDGDFKKGSTKPIAIIIGLVAVLGLGAAIFFGMEKEAEKIPVEKAALIKKELLILPKEEQLPKWREYAKGETSDYLKSEALKQLAFAMDPEGVALAIQSLAHIDQGLRAQAAVALAWYGSPMADGAKDGLVKALDEATDASRPQIAWALVELGDNRKLDKILELYRAGHLATVKRLNEGLAFNPDKIVGLMDMDALAALAGDPSPAVRQMVATVLSRHADPKYTDVLIKLLGDPEGDISRMAAPGLGKIGDEKARTPLLEKLKDTGDDKDSRKKYLEALRDGIGAAGLVLAFEVVPQDLAKSTYWFRTKQIMEMIRMLNDPSGGDALAAYIDSKPHIHWQTMAALALAEVGDLRAVPTLAKRRRLDALKIYSDETDYEMMLKRDNRERVEAARMIADLALIHPEKKEQIREQAEEAVIFWIHELPSPHANGIRALAAMESDKDLKALQKWANPGVPLPLEGQQPPMPEEWVIAQSALRYVGMMKDEKSWKVLEKALASRDKDLDVTMDALLHGGLAILGMTLRALGVGAAHGFSEWGDNKAFKPLLEYIEEPKENEQSRMEACAALAWVATDEDMVKVAEKIQEYSGGDPKDEFRRTCLLETLITRPVPGTGAALVELIGQDSAMKTRHQAARALGKAGLDASIEAKLFEKMKDEALMVDATLALLLGGSADTAARTIAMWADKPKEALDELQDLWFKSFGYWSHEDLDKGHIFRFVDNAVAISRVELKETPQEWAPTLLERQFDNLLYDNGPHSFTRVVLRWKLMEMAKGDDAAKREGAIRTLKFMKEQGVLLTLRDEKGETGKLAAEAYHELLNPKIPVAGSIIDTKEE